ncbi:MAG: flagellar biosynthesis anti-sigma factor FlgM [Armatimonadota bacterium]|nr:flagellar biosynthesis anti-sigma factor FlgM [Armatimonadota bacterium]
MRIDGSGLYRTSASASGADEARGRRSKAVRRAGGDNVALSSRARLMAVAKQALNESPPVRRSAIEAARLRLSDGDAQWDSRAIVEAMERCIARELT